MGFLVVHIGTSTNAVTFTEDWITVIVVLTRTGSTYFPFKNEHYVMV